jgi:hypothetical protein
MYRLGEASALVILSAVGIGAFVGLAAGLVAVAPVLVGALAVRRLRR